MKGRQNVHSALYSQWQPPTSMNPTEGWRPLACSYGCKPLYHNGLCTGHTLTNIWTHSHTHLFIGGWFLTLVPRHTKRKINTKAGRLVVTIGDSPRSSLSPLVYLLPLHYYSHIVHPPNTHHNLLFLFLSVERDKNSTSHPSRGVQFRMSLMVTHFPGTVYFHSACSGAIFCIRLCKPRPPPSRFHALVEVSKVGCGWRQWRSEDWKWLCCKGCGAGGVEGKATGLLQPLRAPEQSISRNTWWASSIVTLSAADVVSRGLSQLIWWTGEVRGNKSSWSPNCGL